MSARSTAHNHNDRTMQPAGQCHGCDALRLLAAASLHPEVYANAEATARAALIAVEDVHVDPWAGSPFANPIGRFAELLRWLGDDNEQHVLEIVVHCDGHDWLDEGLPTERRIDGLSFGVKATEPDYYGGTAGGDAYAWLTHEASGDTLEDAADAVLRLMTERQADIDEAKGKS